MFSNGLFLFFFLLLLLLPPRQPFFLNNKEKGKQSAIKSPDPVGT
jgi:hypothetical protein